MTHIRDKSHVTVMHVQLACWTDPRSDLENVLLMVPPVAIVDAVSVAELGAENRAFSSWAPRRYR